MSAEFDSDAPEPRYSNPIQPDAPARLSPAVFVEPTSNRVTFTYYFHKPPRVFSFDHDRAKGLFTITKADGATEHFRDNPARYLVVEPDPETGDLRPSVKNGKPVYLYLCREQREV